MVTLEETKGMTYCHLGNGRIRIDRLVVVLTDLTRFFCRAGLDAEIPVAKIRSRCAAGALAGAGYLTKTPGGYQMADWDAFTKRKEELFMELNQPKPKQTRPGGKLRFSDLSPEDKREVLSLARFQRRISAALKRD